MTKYSLLVDGREIILNEEELVFIKPLVEKKIKEGKAKFKPAEGKWFEVNPLKIDQKLFEEPRRDGKQEKTRLLIKEAFQMLKMAPSRYGRPFETGIPNWKCLTRLTANGYLALTKRDGEHMANWVEQALEWAQRICNGETWEAVCNEPDTCMYYRVVAWKNGEVQFIGGSRREKIKPEPASSVHEDFDQSNSYWFECSVPLMVRYK